jgi:hypothetical protein
MSLTLKAELLVQLTEALPIDPQRFQDPFSPYTVAQVDANLVSLLYYTFLLDRSDVSLDPKGRVILDFPVPPEDIEFLSRLHWRQSQYVEEFLLAEGRPASIMFH